MLLLYISLILLLIRLSCIVNTACCVDISIDFRRCICTNDKGTGHPVFSQPTPIVLLSCLLSAPSSRGLEES